MKDEDLIKQAREHYKASVEAWSDNREEALDDIKFARLGEQWPEGIKKQREAKSLPCLTINRLPAFIRQVVNDARLNSPSIKVHPVDNTSDPETAEVVNGIIRNIEKASNAEVAYDTAMENAVTCGEGFFRISIDYARNDSFEMDIIFERIANPLSVHFDPYSMATDASDWTYCFVEETMSHDAFEKAYPDAEKVDWEGDKDNDWIGEDSIRVCEYWTRDEIDAELVMLNNGTTMLADRYLEKKQLFDLSGIAVVETRPTKSFKVTQYVMTGEQILETVDWVGQHIPIIPVFGDEIVVENKRYFQSLTRQSKDAQRNYNYWRTASTQKVALSTKAPWIGPKGAFESDAQKWESANTETHAYIEYDGPIPPQQLPPSMADAGSITEALNASDDLKNIMGMQDASLGIAGNEKSGVAIKARAREGDVSTFHFSDNLARGIRYAGTVLLDLIPHVYNKPRVLRVMGLDGEAETVQVNQKFQMNTANGPIEKMHDLTIGKYDLVVEVGPSYTSQREEASTQMADMIRSYPDSAPIIGDLYAKAQDWPMADEIAKRLKTMLPPQIQALDKLDGIPPEAQSVVAQAQGQVQQLTQVIEQGKQMLGHKDEQIKSLEMEKQAKQEELTVKDNDSKRKFDASMAKIKSDEKIVAHKESEENRRLMIEQAVGSMKEYMAELKDNTLGVQQEQSNGVLQGFDVFADSIAQLTEAVADKTKVISISAPSGGIYEGVITEDGNVNIEAPSGANYTGSIREQ